MSPIDVVRDVEAMGSPTHSKQLREPMPRR